MSEIAHPVEAAARWAISIDIEGFGATYESNPQALVSLGALAQGIHKLGTLCYPESPHRIFAHHLGDGFIIVGEFGKTSLGTPISVGIALMRFVLLAGGAAKAALAEGGFADIRSCLPAELGAALGDGNTVTIGRGTMTVLPVMGTAPIRAVATAKKSPSGSLLTLSSKLRHRIPQGIETYDLPGRELVAVDWIHSHTEELAGIHERVGLPILTSQEWESRLRDYVNKNCVRLEWKANTALIHRL